MDDINITGNFEGNIVKGDNNFVVNTNHGTIIRQEALAPRRIGLSPKPPRKPAGFVGRKVETQQVEEWIADCAPVLVYGVDGIGKTSLLKQVANSDPVKSLPDGVVFVEGVDADGKLLEFEDLVQRLFDTLFESQPRLKVDIASARTYLSNTKPLVLLNSLSLTAENLEQLADLFPEAPILIATEIDDHPDTYESISLGPLARDESLSLLAGTAGTDNQEALSQIAALLEYVPAALIMVKKAIREKGLSAEDVLARLQRYTANEQNKAKAGLERAFALVFSTLTENERGMLIQTAAAHGISVDRKWLENEYGGSAISEQLESLELLQANSPRLRLMPGLKPLLLEGRDVSKERERLLSYLLTELKTRWNDVEFLKDELGNLLGLLAWSAAAGQWTNVAALGRAVDPYLTLRGLWGAWRKTLNEIQRAANSMQNLALQGWVLHQLGTYEIGVGNQVAARSLLQQAVSIRQKLGDQIGAAYSQHNLQLAAPTPAIKPTNQSGKWIAGVVGGLAVVAVAAFFLFNNFQKNQPPPTAAPVVGAPSTVQAIASATGTATMTSTPTQTATPSPSATATFTLSPTDTASATPTYAVLSGIIVTDTAYCFYGPGTMYLNKGTARIKGNQVDLLGRIETNKGVWVNTKFTLPRTDASDPCWMDAKYLDITPEQLMSVQPIDPNNPNEYKLPIDHNSTTYLDDPEVTGVSRSGATVTIQWKYFDVGVGQYAEHDPNAFRYLIEAWLCKAGKLVFTPSGWKPFNPDVSTGDIVSAQVADEPGCSEPSHARLYLAWAHAYVGPTEIQPWP